MSASLRSHAAEWAGKTGGEVEQTDPGGPHHDAGLHRPGLVHGGDQVGGGVAEVPLRRRDVLGCEAVDLVDLGASPDRQALGREVLRVDRQRDGRIRGSAAIRAAGWRMPALGPAT